MEIESTTIINEENTNATSGFEGILAAIEGVFKAILAFFQGIADMFKNLFNPDANA